MYNEIVARHFMDPMNVGELASPDETVRIGNAVCGDTIIMHLALEDGRITDVKYRAYGCAVSIATASIASEYFTGKELKELSGRSNAELAALLGELEPNQKHCIDIMLELRERACASVQGVNG
ncbi:iron-sulfur cluster assembly scaffold protein [Paenibacillus kobensis]|uniref:iron-sulfur cluster assembly scaffold protein n=1 Tax=Paenibacillus kobensis TaxID=59841 RepID=UPI000FD82D6E|nr:iron-sulfur cluster assembly scaffold protein [Paenibacillus kobensis]